MATSKENPFNYESHVIEHLDATSGEMYDAFFDLLATYQFDFSLEEKEWMLMRIVSDIRTANNSQTE